MTYKIDQIIKVLKAKNHPVFEVDTKPYNLNIVGIRTSDNGSNT